MRKCKLCGKLDHPNHYNDCREKKIMEEMHYCFNCAFWEHYARQYENDLRRGTVFFIDGNRYQDGGRTNNKGFVGFGGREFKIKLIASDKVVETNNLWHQGTVPTYFRDRMPNTAIFI